ncbi:23S rRNA (uracil-5-)-methyltransferase RumA, partial [Tyzzerella sp. OttesenSCG-928-J15]|nr:23S rRNA (uracil-5-)-methyltransferase RumA [Tyzzerella sp. OttesenSCG-928-J15]
MAKARNAEIRIDDFRFPNIGTGSFEGDEIQVKRALPGQKVEINISKRKGKYKGRIINLISKAENEVEPLCPNTNSCGGCTFQTLTYGDEIRLKHKMVKDLFDNASISFENADIFEAPETYGYRNKMEFSFGDEYKDGPLNLGLRNPGSFYEVCDGSLCNICDGDFNKITKFTKEHFGRQGALFYHRTRHTGQMRHLVIRKGKYTGDILVNLVTSAEFNFDMEEYVSEILKLSLEGHISGILHTINSSVADVVQADEMRLIYGKDYLTDKILGLSFKIYPFSFFQTNTAGAEKLYSTVREFCGSQKVDT